MEQWVQTIIKRLSNNMCKLYRNYKKNMLPNLKCNVK